MSLSTSATYPLTPFDTSSERTTFVTGWLVSGRVNADLLAEALERVTQKWRMLAGRVEVKPASGVDTKRKSYQIRVPLGPLPPPSTYHTYTLTTTHYPSPLSSLIPLPLPTISKKLPANVFVHPSTPILTYRWAEEAAPLTAWHLTYFPPETEDSAGYTAIGFARAHGVFDGLSASAIVDALQAEMFNRQWDVPPLPHAGENPNRLIEALDDIPKEHHASIPVGSSNLTLWGIAKLVMFHLWEKWWHRCEESIVIVPKKAMEGLVQGIRNTTGGEVSSGDVITAWALKTIYKNDKPSQRTINWSNMASFRHLLFPGNMPYAHNAFIPIPYPLITVSALQNTSVSELSLSLAQARKALTSQHVRASYEHLQKTPFGVVHYNSSADDVVLMSNVSSSRILEVDWSAVTDAEESAETKSETRTVAGYRYALTTTRMPFTNTVYVSGRLPDTCALVLDVFLRRTRMAALQEEVERLVRETV